MHEDLLGYLLDALDDSERDRIEQALKTNPEMQRKLEALKEELQLLADEADSTAPPGLADRTCEMIADLEADAAAETEPPRSAHAAHPVYLSARGRSELSGSPRSTSVADTVVAAGIFLAAAFLFVPAIANSRYRSEITACQYNLQRLGAALSNFSEKSDGQFPSIPVSGKRAVAGVYASQLLQDQLLTESGWLICPSSELAQKRDGWFVPTLDQLDAAEGRWLSRLQRSVGGSYGYTLGYVHEGHYRSQRNEHRPYFALMADAPSQHLAGHQSANHGGRGQNVLFEDNHIEFIRSSPNGLPGGSLFLNHAGFTEAGLDKDDTVIVASETSPLLP